VPGWRHYYAPDSRRVYRKATDGTEYMYFYGVNGERLPYQMGSYVGQLTGTPPAYFAGRRLGWGATADRLGSVRVAAYYPYGEYEGTASGDDVRFATYVRDSATGLDYAVNRYYSSIIGRFLSPDRSRRGADLRRPQSWNAYGYVENDPVNANDPTGQNRVFIGYGWDWDIGPEGDVVPVYLPQFGWEMDEPTAVPTETSTPMEEWSNLSVDCQEALKSAMPKARIPAMLAALGRAKAAESTLEAATSGTKIDWTMLAAIGIRESGFQNTNQKGGAAVGIFQIDLAQNHTVTAQTASSIGSAAQWAAGYLARNANQISGAIPGLSSNDIEWMLAASWNTGAQGQIARYNNGRDPDWHTAPTGSGRYRNDYGKNVLDLMDCF
jgi:RHS repeat-associated protein